MRILVCGGRNYRDLDAIYAALDSLRALHGELTIIEGGASGADCFARAWGATRQQRGVTFPADWATHGRKAGPLRNQRMLDKGKPDLVLAFPGGRGTADMVRRAKAAGVPVTEVA